MVLSDPGRPRGDPGGFFWADGTCVFFLLECLRGGGMAMRLLEEGEVHATVLALFHEAGMIGEIVVLAMLQYQEAIFAQ